MRARNFPRRSLLPFRDAKSAVAPGIGDRRPHSRPRSLTINTASPTRDIRRIAGLVAALAAALLTFSVGASTALAQDPAVDQYAPSTPTVGGPETPTEPPVPATEPGGGPADVSTSGGGADDGSSSSSGSSGTSGTDTSTAPVETTSGTTSTGTVSKAVEQPKNRDKGTVEGLAASAEQQRLATTSDSGESPVTNLARSDDGGGDGVGILLFALLGITLVWAIASGVSRRRSEDGHPA